MAAGSNIELKEIVTRAAGGDPDAWESIYRRSHGRLFAFARRRLTSDIAAEDAVSETMTRALEKIDTFTWRGAGLDGWLFGILRNVVLEQYRSGAREMPEDAAPAATSPHEQGPEAIAERSDSRRKMKRAFGLLAESDREVLELSVVAELNSGEAAEVLGKRSGAIRMARARALERLRKHLGSVEAEDA